MLPLPKALQIDRDYEEEKNLAKLAREHIEKGDRTGIHMSDLIDMRLAYFKWLTKQPLPDRLINMFVVGQALHAVMLCIKGGTDDYTRPTDGGTQLFEEIQYSPDFLEMADGSPNEIKTTRSFYLPKVPYLPNDSTYHMYLEQLVGYMACQDKLVGRLTLLYLNHKEDNKTTPSIFVFKVTCTSRQLEAMRHVLVKAKDQLKLAKETKDHTILPLCRPWKCGDNCEFFTKELCNPAGRIEFGGSDKAKKGDWTA